MRRLAIALAVCVFPLSLAAQDAQSELVEVAQGGLIRVLDRVSGDLSDLEMMAGQEVDYGRIRIGMSECRFPADDPASDAFAFVTVTNLGDADPAFSGWMVASSPALNALDHPRYDVWVMRCVNS